MNLDPTVSPWIGVFASTGVCLWMAAIGAPLAKAVFGDRPRPVWPFYAPVLGIVSVLLATNLSAYVVPGAPSAWFGFLAPSALGLVVAWRRGAIHRPSRRAALTLIVLVLSSAAVYLVAFANRTHVRHGDEAWHFALALRMARGVFPPVTPYGPDAGIGYHYGHNLLASSIVNLAAVPAWTALAALMSFLFVALILAAIGYAWDFGAPLPLSLGIAAAVGLFFGVVAVGLPLDAQATSSAVGLLGLPDAWANVQSTEIVPWLQVPQRTLAVAIVVLIAATLQAGVARRHAAALACAAGVSALAEVAVMIFSSVALGVVGTTRLVRLQGRERLAWTMALVLAGLLVVVAGGPLSDALFRRGGTAGMVHIAFEPTPADVRLFDLAPPALVQVGTIPLVVISACVAAVRRNLGMAYLAVAAAAGLVESMFLQSPIPRNDERILNSAMAVALLAALSGVGWLTSRLSGWQRASAALATILLVVLPTALPRAVTTGKHALAGVQVAAPAVDGSGYPFVGQSRIRAELEANWDFYTWVANALSVDARLLTTHPAPIASTTGIAVPTSGRHLQVLAGDVTPVYEDALRFLQRDDLADMAITHLHVTDALQAALAPQARRLLDDPRHFKLLVDLRSVSGRRHRVFEVMPGAGLPRADPSSYRALRERIHPEAPVFLVGGLTEYQRRMVLFTLIDQDQLRGPPTFINRMTRFPRSQSAEEIPSQGVLAVPDYLEPLMLGLSRDDAIWNGYGIRVYDLEAAWSSVWRVGPDLAPLPTHLRALCESAPSRLLTFKLLGEPGDLLVAGPASTTLSGSPQRIDVEVPDCQSLAFAAQGSIAPFAQLQLPRNDIGARPPPASAGLAFDGSVDGESLVINLWYRNPRNLPMTAGTEFRLYELGEMAFTPVDPDPRASIRWWPGPLVLAPDRQMARIEFVLPRVAIDGDPGTAKDVYLVPGRNYLLTLNLAAADDRSGYAEIRRQIPMAQIAVERAGASAEVFSGIVTIRPTTSGAVNRWLLYSAGVGWGIDRTP
ncbi:MAG: hypothetical protein OXG65_01055 [Chloroflexi bacterium]|nr:hypothetical protein [Chloroflexota bacterium]